MRKYAVLTALALTVACKKEEKAAVEPPAQPEFVEVTYQLQSFTDAPFESISYAAGKQGLTDENGQKSRWKLDAGKGTFIRKTLIKRGRPIVFGANNLTSADFILRISTRYETATIHAKDYPSSPSAQAHYAEVKLENSTGVPEEKPAFTEMVAVTYEVRSFTDTPFRHVQYSEMHENDHGIRGTASRRWEISGKGTFTKTVYIERGFGAFLSARHNTSGNFILNIRTSYENASDTGKDYHLPESPGYRADVSLLNRDDE